jgi:3-oxoadipate enol-lactonase
MPYVQTRLGRWFYEERGKRAKPDDAAIVLLHGFLFDGRLFAPQMGPLAELGRVLVFDGPGHGKSEVPPPFSLEDHAEALVDAFRDLDVREAILCGLSWGGMISMRLAIKQSGRRPGVPPETHGRVRALALIDTSADVEPRADRIKNRAFLSMHRRVGLPIGLFWSQAAPLLWGPHALRYQRPLIERCGRDTLGFSREGVYRAGRAVMIDRTRILDQLHRIRVPTLVLCGRDDAATPPEQSRAIAAAIVGSRLAFIDEAGHSSTLEQPERVNAELVPFVRDALTDPHRATHAAP